MLYMGPWGKDRGSLVDPRVMDEYVEKLLGWVSRGCTWIGVDFNDWFAQTTITAEEREKIGDSADIMSFVTNETYKRVREKYPKVGFVVVESQYKQATPDTIKFCQKIPNDVLVISTGPPTTAAGYNCLITAEFLGEWAKQTGRKPFLWDNGLYRQLDHLAPFVNRIYNLNAYRNRLPAHPEEYLSGPGIHLNGGAKRWWAPGALTFLDYAWNPEAYNAEESLRKARVMLWGKAAADAAAGAEKTLAGFYGYLHVVHQDPGKASRPEADERFVEVSKAVKNLESLLQDAVTRDELESQCLAVAKQKLDAAFLPDKPARPKRVK
jgi:hypothetical protein